MRVLAPFASVLVASILSLAPLGVAAEHVMATYRAYIGPDDLVDASGGRLGDAAKILGRDRANLHRFDVRQDGDEWDPIFASIDARQALDGLLAAGSITPDAQAAILAGGATVEVRIRVHENRPVAIEVALP